MTVGECLHLSGGICSEGKYQNFCCPYKNIDKCPCSIKVTEKMVEQWNTKGFVSLSFSELKYNPLNV